MCQEAVRDYIGLTDKNWMISWKSCRQLPQAGEEERIILFGEWYAGELEHSSTYPSVLAETMFYSYNEKSR